MELGNFFGSSASTNPYGAEPRASAAPQNGKVPPHSLEAEMSVLGGVLLDNSSLDRVHETNLVAEDFYKEAHQRIFRCILELVSRGQPADLTTLTAALNNGGLLEKTGGRPYLAELASYEYSAANIAAYANIIKDKSIERKIIHVCTEQSQKAFSGVEDHSQFKEETEKKILEATSERKVSTYTSLSENLLEVFNHLQEMASKNTQMTGVASGFKDLDHETMGWHPGQLIIVAARPGMGKTSFMLNTALNATVFSKISVAVFSMEMSKHELTMRLLSMEAKVDAGRLKNASRLQDQDWRNLQRAAGKLNDCSLFLDDTPALNLLELKSRCRRIQSQHGLGLVVVDYLQLMRGLGNNGKGGSSSREQEIAEISRGLKALAKELAIPIIAASQLNRMVENRQVKKPQLSDLRESGAIEQDADMVLFIHRDKDNPELKNEAELIIGKHRAGNTGEIKLAWIGQHTTFKDFASAGDYGNAPEANENIF